MLSSILFVNILTLLNLKSVVEPDEHDSHVKVSDTFVIFLTENTNIFEQ